VGEWADWFAKKSAEQMSNPAAPEGLTATASRFADKQNSWAAAGQGLQPWQPEASYMETARSWYGGQNPNSTKNGWDTDFLEKAFDQQYEELQKGFTPDENGVRHQSRYYGWLDRPDATGVATWNDPSNRFKRGDVFVNGQKQEGQNLYDVFDEYTADVMMADFMFDDSDKERLNKENDPRAAYRAAVEDYVTESSRAAQVAPGAEEFQSDVKGTQQRYLQGWQQPALAGGSGIATGLTVYTAVAGTAFLAGAGATAWTGPGALIAGGLAAAGATALAWLNSDSLTETAAYATEVVNKSQDRGSHNLLHDTGTAVGVYGGTLGRKLINPASNAVQGGMEVFGGGAVGDGTARFYELDANGERVASGRWQALDFGAMALDAVALWSSPVGKLLDIGTMGANVVGGVTNLASLEGFNQRIGDFDRYENGRELSAAVGNIGIDVVQMGTMGAMAQRAKTLGKDLLWGGKATGAVGAPGGEAVLSGTRFTLDAQGNAVSHKMTMERWAPSEALRWQTVNLRARVRAQRTDGLVDSNALYQAAKDMTTDRAWVQGVVNGFAEGTEEFAQGILEPVSYSEAIDPDALLAGTVGGFMGGMGMSLGSLVRPANPAQIREGAIKINFMRANGLSTIDDQTWSEHYAGMSETDKKVLERLDPTALDEVGNAWKAMSRMQRANVGSTSVLGQAGLEAVREGAIERHLRNARPATDSRVKALGQNGGVISVNGQLEEIGGGNSAIHSPTQFITMLNKQLDAWIEMGRRTDLPAEMVADISAQIRVKAATFKFFYASYQRLMEERDPAEQKRLISEINRAIDHLYEGRETDGSPLSPDSQWFAQRSIEFVYKRDPLMGAGSVSIFRPQVSFELHRANGHGVAIFNSPTLKSPGMDHDGDDAADLNMEYWSREDWERMRAGAHYTPQGPSESTIAVDTPNPADPNKTVTLEVPGASVIKAEMDVPDDEDIRLNIIFEMLTVPGSPRAQIVNDAFEHWYANVLEPHYVTSGVQTAQEFEDAWLEFTLNCFNQDKDARLKLIERLFANNPQQMLLLYRTNPHQTPESIWLMDELTKLQNKILMDQAKLNAMEWMQQYRADPDKAVMMSPAWRMPEELKFQEELAVRHAINQGTSLGVLLGADPNRAGMKLYYTFYRSVVDPAGLDPAGGGWVPEAVQDLARQYTLLNSGEVESSTAQLEDSSRIENMVIGWLRDMVSLGNQPITPQAMVQVAMTRVPDFADDPETGIAYLPPDAGQISMLQLLLRKAVAIEEARIAALPADDPARAKITLFKNLSHAGQKSSYTAKTSFMEVFRDRPFYEVVGEDAAYVGPNMTLGQFEAQMMGRDSDTRSAMKAALRMSPAYNSHNKQGDPPYWTDQLVSDGATPPGINAFTMVMDAVFASTDTKVARFTTKDNDSIVSLENTLGSLVTALKNHRAANDHLKQADMTVVLNDYLQTHPRVKAKIIEALPPDALPAIFRGNDAVPSVWLEQVLSGLDYEGNPTTPAHLAVIFRWQSWLASFNAAGGRIVEPRKAKKLETPEQKADADRKYRAEKGVTGAVRYGHLNSRMLQLFHRLAAKSVAEAGELTDEKVKAARVTPGRGALLDLDLLMEMGYKATSLHELRENINAMSAWHVGREQTFMMFDDKSDFEMDPSSVWSTTLPGNIQRERIAELQDLISLTNSLSEELATARKLDEPTTARLEAYHKAVVARQKDPTAPLPTTSGNTARLYALLDQALTMRVKMTDSIGPNIQNLIADAAIDGLIAVHSKGQTDDDFAAYGDAIVTLKSLGVMTGVDQETAAWTAHDWHDVQANLTKLAEGPHLIQWDDGSHTKVDFSDIGFVIQALGDQRLRAVALAVIVQTSRDIGLQGTLGNYHDVISDNMTLADILEEQNLNQLFSQTRPVTERANRALAYATAHMVKAADKATKDEADRAQDYVNNLFNDFLIMYMQQPGVQHVDKESLRDELRVDLYDTLTLIARLKTDEEREALRTTMKLALVHRTKDQREKAAEIAQGEVQEALQSEAIVYVLSKYVGEADVKNAKALKKAGIALMDAQAAGDQAAEQEAQDRIDEITERQKAIDEAKASLNSGQVINLPRFDDLDVNIYIQKFQLNPQDPTGNVHKKQNILEVLLSGNTVERFRTDATTNALIQKAIKLGSKRNKSFFFFPKAGTRGITAEEWDTLAGWCVAASISDAASRGSSQVQLLPLILDTDKGLQSQKYYDVTGSGLVDDLFDPALIHAFQEFTGLASDLPEAYVRPTVKKVRERTLNSLFDQRKFGTWTDRVPVEGMKMRSILRNATVKLAIPRGGNTPRKIMDLIASGFVTVDTLPVPTEHHTTLTLNNIDHLAVLENHLDWLDIMKLDNHFVHSVKVRPGPKTLAAGNAQILPELDMMQTNATLKNYSHPTVETSGYEVLSIATLQSELDARLGDEGYLDFTLEIDYVDVDKKPYTKEYVNSIYFDGVGRETHLGRGGGPLAQMWLAQGGLSKISQQQPLNWLTKAGERFRHMTMTAFEDVIALEESGLSVAELMHAKAFRLLTKDDYETGFLLREDIPALYKMIKMRHVIVGWERDATTGKKVKRLYWADEWIQMERTGSTPNLEGMALVKLSESNTQTLLGRMGTKGKKGVWGSPGLVLSDGDSMPSLGAERLKELGLERLGEETAAANSPLAQVEPRAKTRYLSGDSIRRAQRKYETKMRKWETEAAPYRTARKEAHGSRAFNARKQKNTHMGTLLDYLVPEKFASVISNIGVPIDRLVDPASYAATKSIAGRIEKIQKDYPQATVSLYVRDGSSDPTQGLYAAAEMDSDFDSVQDYQRPIVKDVWLFDVDAFLRLAGPDQERAYNMAKMDLKKLMARGVYVVPVTKQGNIDFRADLITWINTGEMGYRVMADSSYMFGPADPSADIGVNTAANESTLSNTQVFDGRNDNFILRVLGPWFGGSENTVNFLPKRQKYMKHAATIIPTKYSNTERSEASEWMYGLPTEAIVPGSGGITQKQQVARLLLDILNDPEGLEWMATELAEGDPKTRKGLDLYTEHPNGDITEGILPIRKALEDLKDELNAGEDPIRASKTFRIGMAYPMLSADGHTVMIGRLGFKAPDPYQHDEMVGKAFKDIPSRIAVFKGEVEDAHTTTPPMRVNKIETDKRGVKVFGEYELSEVGKRGNEGTGYKPGHVVWSENLFVPPDVSLSQINETHISESSSWKSPAGKNSIGGDEGGLINGFKEMFVLGGFDGWGYMVDFLFGHDPKRSKAEYDRLEAVANEVLQEWANRDHFFTAAQVETLLTANVFGAHLDNELLSTAQDVAGADLRAGLTWEYNQQNTAAEQADITKRMATILLAQLSVPGVKVHHVMGTPGILTLSDSSTNTQVRALPDLMCDAMNDIRFWPLKDQLIGRMNATFKRDANGDPVYWFDDNFTFWYRSKDAQGNEELIDVGLQLVLDQPADQNPVTNLHANQTKRKMDVSAHYTTIVMGATGGIPITGKALDITNENPNIVDFENGTSLFDVLTRVDTIDRTFPTEAPVTPLENNHYRVSAHKVGIYSQPVVTPEDPSQPTAQVEIDKLVKDLLMEMGFSTSQVENMRTEVDYLVRQFYGKPGPDDTDQAFAEEITAHFYKEAVQIMLNNVKSKMHPLHGGTVYWPHHSFWKMAYLANQGKPVEKRWGPVIKEGRGKTKIASTWYEWVHALVGQVEDSKHDMDATFRTANDGFWHTYQGALPEFNTVELTADEMVKLRLRDPITNERYVSQDPITRKALESPEIGEFVTLTYDILIGEQIAVGSVEDSMGKSFGSLAEQLEYRKKWQENNKIKRQEKKSIRDYLKEGVVYQDTTKKSTLFMRSVVNLSMQRLLMPALWVEALISVPTRQGLEHMTSLLLGEYSGKGADSTAAETLRLQTKRTPEEVKLIRRAAEMLGSDPSWLASIIKDVTYKSAVLPGGSSAVAQGLERFAQYSARVFADPRWGMRGRAVAMRYLDGALDYYDATGTMMTPAQLVENLRKDPKWIEHEATKGTVSAHSVGTARLGQVRGTRNTVVNKFIMKGVDSLCASDRMIFAGTGHLALLPLQFNRFAMNQFMTLTGLNFFDQMLAVHLHGKKKGDSLLVRSINRTLGRDDPRAGDYDMSDVIDSLDLSRAVARTGVSQTAFMMAGFMANGWGLGGEDEEMRRRRRMAMYMDVPLQYDPRRAENDFVNADAIWLDSVPSFFGIGDALKTHYMDPETGRSSMVPHWILQQFTSPMLGIQRFFETGDIREVGYGFLDAAQVLPYSVLNIWNEAEVTARLLADAAKTEDLGKDAEAQAQTYSFFTKVAAIYEKMLVESTFVNTIRNGYDEFDRNPWFVPQTDETGNIVMAEGYNNKPLRTDALVDDIQMQQKRDENGNPLVDEDGQPVMEPLVDTSYRTRTGSQAAMHQYAENNFTFAVIASLISGQLGDESSYWRKNMVNTEQYVALPKSTEADLEALVMSAYIGQGGQQNFTFEETVKVIKAQYEAANIYWKQDQVEKDAKAVLEAHSEIGALSVISPEGRELITDEGMEAVFRGLQGGTVTLEDASLQGIHADKAMRDRIAGRITEGLIKEGIEYGLSEEQAMYRMRRFWYGDSTNPATAGGLRALIYSNAIPQSDTQRYDQLNVTYAIGPDGKPWATPFERASIWSAVLPVAKTTLASGPGMSKDKTRGKDTDELLGINTGMHGLVRQQEEPLEPDDKPMEKAAAKDYTKADTGVSRSPWKKFGRSGYGGGGGYSSNARPYFQRMQPLPSGGESPRIDGIRQVNTSNPYIRRSQVREERISSERGRLKQWQ
jgi:hypothetical protein